ncbi:MmcQ/YjbR family DNA-binding protein [Streptomyces sp. NBC_01433]|uniref:MmcQ/YjbR family DNA-binding protein n=1 Tax=Streptomyces sp. NBC_01433 TaxID=2903864 RepID=UPI00225AC465|nr:MmcQ/YjbR family DNA-binding protein [Streptomyces sp. NBC_01433]MCX4679960.1 MmcQ/YjbR family DNA-binding protein [Streptomyces sp. NBC_01433]
MTLTADDVRSIALSLPEATEKQAWGQPTFRVAGKIFAALGDDDTTMGVKCPIEERVELISSEPHKFFVREGHDDRYGWLRVRIAALDGTAELTAILADSWRQAASRGLLAAHPELGSPG